MNSVELNGKTVELAVNQALTKLSATREEVDIKIIDEGAKGFFGIGSRLAKVSVTIKYNPERLAKEFLEEILSAMEINSTVEVSLKDKNLLVEIKGDNMGILIGKRGQTLDSLQYLLNLYVNKGEAAYISITLDTENYRKRRKDTLESLARNLAKKAKATKKNVVLEPMSAYERRIIHATLQSDKTIRTYSEGNEPYRHIVIAPK